MKQIVTLCDVNSTFFKVVDSDVPQIENHRFKSYEKANKVALKHNGKVAIVTKRIKETMEMELAG
jgi:hypothetical protein